MAIFHTQGFDTPPTGVIHVLAQLDWPGESSVHVLDPLNGRAIDVESIAQDTSANRFVIINTHEPASHHWFDRLIPQIHHQAALPLINICIRSSCLHNPNSPVGHVGSIVDYVTDTVSEYPMIKTLSNRSIQHHYVCLNAQHRWQRLELVLALMDRDLDRLGRVSYLDTADRALPEKHRDRFPMVLDRPSVTWSQGHEIFHDFLTGAVVNVITESSFDPEPGMQSLIHHHLPCVTEKTWKSILLAQLPIWLAPRHTVACYRALGFDAFDDVIDHAYDLEPDPHVRIKMVTDEISRLCLKSLSDWQILLDSLLPRFQANLDHFRSWSGAHHRDLPKWQEWLTKIAQSETVDR